MKPVSYSPRRRGQLEILPAGIVAHTLLDAAPALVPGPKPPRNLPAHDWHANC
jgi:hypothetical protein